ncbi:MAG: HD domain-containing protein [Clostridia bacterium]|nr:HD domain-containing protein [Clostridia bacterium]
MEPREFLDIMHVAERLKDTIRHCTSSKGRPESVAEHSWRLSLMAFLLKDQFPDTDMDRVTEMCLIHDLGECFTGDIPSFKKTSDDTAREDRLLETWVDGLPEELRCRMKGLYSEMNALETKEARLYKCFDKLEAVIQHNESPLDTWTGLEYELNRTYGTEIASERDFTKRLRKEILKDTENKIETEKTGRNGSMEEQIITITVKTSGEKCELDDEAIRKWYEDSVAGLFNPEYGIPEIGVSVRRIPLPGGEKDS